MNNGIHKILSELKDDARAGRADDLFVASLKKEILAFEPVKTKARAPRAVLDFAFRIPSELTDIVARPMALASMVIMMVLGGWITSVNASLSTVPGDALYPVKLATERAQLTLAPDQARRKLHAEFASRRVDEIATLMQDERVDKKDERVRVALDGFTKQIQAVSHDLPVLEDHKDVIEVARLIEQSTDELEAVFDLSEAVQDQSRDAISVAVTETDGVKGQVVDTLAEDSEESPVSRAELSRQYQNELQNVQSRILLTLPRIERLQAILLERELTAEELNLDLYSLERRLAVMDLSESMDIAAAGGYAEAYNLLTVQRAELRKINNALAAAELALVARAQQPKEEPSDEEIEEGEEKEVSSEPERKNTLEESAVEATPSEETTPVPTEDSLKKEEVGE